MAKRIGANGRNKSGARRAGRTTHRKMPVVALALVAITIAGCLVISRYGHHLRALALRCDVFKTAMAQRLEIEGAVQVNPEELIRRSGIIFPLTVEQLKKVHLTTLEKASPWIDKIKISGLRDGKLVLRVSERKPVAMLRSGASGAICLVDTRGVCLPLGAGVEYPLPLLSGLRDSAGEDGIRRITATGTSRMARFFRDAAAARDASIAKTVTQINFGRAPIIRIMLEGSATVVVINENDIAGCIEKYSGIRETVLSVSPEPLRIDLAYRNLAFVTPDSTPRPVGSRESITRKTKG